MFPECKGNKCHYLQEGHPFFQLTHKWILTCYQDGFPTGTIIQLKNTLKYGNKESYLNSFKKSELWNILKQSFFHFFYILRKNKARPKVTMYCQVKILSSQDNFHSVLLYFLQIKVLLQCLQTVYSLKKMKESLWNPASARVMTRIPELKWSLSRLYINDCTFYLILTYCK